MHETVFTDHVTIAYKPQNMELLYDLPLGETVTFTINSCVSNDICQCVPVEADSTGERLLEVMKKSFPHVTISTVSSVGPVYSNHLLMLHDAEGKGSSSPSSVELPGLSGEVLPEEISSLSCIRSDATLTIDAVIGVIVECHEDLAELLSTLPSEVSRRLQAFEKELTDNKDNEMMMVKELHFGPGELTPSERYTLHKYCRMKGGLKSVSKGPKSGRTLVITSSRHVTTASFTEDEKGCKGDDDDAVKKEKDIKGWKSVPPEQLMIVNPIVWKNLIDSNRLVLAVAPPTASSSV